MSKYTYADWSPASVFGSTVAASTSSAGSPAVTVNSKVSPKKRGTIASLQPQNDAVRSNNDDECHEDKLSIRVRTNARVERDEQLAALLLQRQVQVWLLRRQESLRVQEVERLRRELHLAAVSVIRESYRRYVKRQAIQKYLHEVGEAETQLNVLLQGCIARKRQMEEAQRFAHVRRQQKQLEEDRQRRLVHDWLALCVRNGRVKQELRLQRARTKLLGWVRRWLLRKRVEARAAAQEVERQRQAHRCSSALAIANFYRMCTLRHRAKAELQRRRCCRDGLVILSSTFRMSALRLAHFSWQARVQKLKLADEAARKLQRVYRTRKSAARLVRYKTSCLLLQRVFRGHSARKLCARLKQGRLEETRRRQLNEAATVIQRYARGRLTRAWFSEVLRKLRERFRCTNCGVIEPSGTYCKYCGRHRTTSGPLWSVLLLHEKWQLDRSSYTVKPAHTTPTSPEITALSPQKPRLDRSNSASLKTVATSPSASTDDHGSLTSLPVVLSPRHRRLVAHNTGSFTRSKSLTRSNLDVSRRNSSSSISEQTALRAAALADLQAKCNATAQAHALEVHLARLERANTVINRVSTKRASIV